MNAEPMIKLDPGGSAPVLRYSIPDKVSYSGQNFIELELPDAHFTTKAKARPSSTRSNLADQSSSALRAAVASGLQNGFADRKLFPNIKFSSTPLRPGLLGGAPNPKVSAKLAALDADEVTMQIQSGMRLNIFSGLSGKLKYNFIPEPKVVRPRIMLVERYRLSSFLGDYGAGKVIKTFSMFPGEKTKISIKTYTRTESDAKSASSILDSVTEESADDFESAVQSEQSEKEQSTESFEYSANVESEAAWGWGSAKVSGGVSGGSTGAREEFVKNTSSATEKHSAKASSKRDININTSYEVKQQSGEETSIEREIQNINLSRTLNLVFRQMNQEFVTLLHLVDVRVAFFNGFAESREEVPLYKLNYLLGQYVVASKRTEVREAIMGELQNIFDYEGKPHVVVDETALKDLSGQDIPGSKFPRFDSKKTHTYKDPVGGSSFTVPGVIVSAQKSVMRTEGVIVDAVLGQGEALDSYALRLQEIEIEKRKAEAAKLAADAAQTALANDLAKTGDAAKASVLASLIHPIPAPPAS